MNTRTKEDNRNKFFGNEIFESNNLASNQKNNEIVIPENSTKPLETPIEKVNVGKKKIGNKNTVARKVYNETLSSKLIFFNITGEKVVSNKYASM